MSRSIILDEYVVGTKIVIIKQPSFWSSSLNKKYPIDHDVVYPYYGIIKEIRNENDHISMIDGNYGWDLTTLIDEDLINNITKLRKEKLKKLKNVK
jgi:hypothetical protein